MAGITSFFTESTVEEAALAWLESLGWRIAHGPEMAPHMPAAERRDYGEVVQARPFAEMLEQAVRRYQNPAIEAAQVIEELIALAKDMREANARGETLGLSEEELAFYDALETNDSAVEVLSEPRLPMIALELVRTVRANLTIDWTLRENVCAQLRVLVKRILRKHGYPPVKEVHATELVLEQAEVLCRDRTART